jgi:hypothetical protein
LNPDSRPLSQKLGTTDVTTSKIPGNESWIAYDPLYTPAGMTGSPMFTKELGHKSFVQLFPASKVTRPASKQLSILGWLRPDAPNEGTVLVKICKFLKKYAYKIQFYSQLAKRVFTFA